MVDAVLHATDDTFESEVIKSEVPVLLDFWAPWCGPCKALNPVIDAVAEEFSGRAKVVKVNIDENPETKAKYGVRGIPHLLIINEGETATNVGTIRSRAGLTKVLEGYVGGKSTKGVFEENLEDLELRQSFILEADLDRVRAVLKANPNYLNEKMKWDQTPISLVLSSRKYDRVDFLLNEFDPELTLLDLAGIGLAERLDEYISANPQLKQAPQKELVEAMTASISHQRLDCIDVLLKAGVDVNHKPDGKSSIFLWYSSFGERLPALKHLVSRGLDVGARMGRNQNLVHVAAYTGDEILLDYALEQDLPVNIETDNGETPLAMAKRGLEKNPDCQSIIEKLEAVGAK